MSANLNELVGKTFLNVFQGEYDDNDAVYFDDVFVLGHSQNCCESVNLEEIIGDLEDLAETPILEAREDCNSPDLPSHESCTWTFYNFRTVKGSVTLRFFGTSNGYYSERAELYKIKTI